MQHFKDKSVFRDVLVCPRFLDTNVSTYGKQQFKTITDHDATKNDKERPQPPMSPVPEVDHENSATTFSQPKTPFSPMDENGKGPETPVKIPLTPFSHVSKESGQSKKSNPSSGMHAIESLKRSFQKKWLNVILITPLVFI